MSWEPERPYNILYWDVFPRELYSSDGAEHQQQLEIVGDFTSAVYESDDETIATVTAGGLVTFGTKPGKTKVRVWVTQFPDHIREVEVEVFGGIWIGYTGP